MGHSGDVLLRLVRLGWIAVTRAFPQVVSPTGASPRKKKTWWPQNAQRWGTRIQRKALSRKLRGSTLRNSIDLQYGQRGEKRPKTMRDMRLDFPFWDGDRCRRGGWLPGNRCAMHAGGVAPTAGGATRFAGRLDLFGSSEVGFGLFGVVLGARHLPFMELA